MVFMWRYGIGALNHNIEDWDKINAGFNPPPPGSTQDNTIELRGETVTVKFIRVHNISLAGLQLI